MKPLYEYLIGGNKAGRAVKYQYHPMSWYELHNLMYELVKQRGMDGDYNDIDTSQVEDMNGLFTGPMFDDFNGDITKWNTSRVTNMENMFRYCHKFNRDLSDWDVSRVEEMKGMFYECTLFNQDLSHWDVTAVKHMDYMFKGTKKLKQDFSSWEDKFISLKSCSRMFEGSLMEKHMNWIPKFYSKDL
jgi:surface protein